MNHKEATPQARTLWTLCNPARIPEIARRAALLPEDATREQAYAEIAAAAGRTVREVESCHLPWEIAFAYGFDGHRRTAAEIEDLLRPRTENDYVIEDVTVGGVGA